MKTTILAGCLLAAGLVTVAFIEPKEQTKSYKLELTAQEVQLVYDALGELPAKTSESVRLKIAKQVNEQNNVTK
jgi:hypothetical protein